LKKLLFDESFESKNQKLVRSRSVRHDIKSRQKDKQTKLTNSLDASSGFAAFENSPPSGGILG